MRYAETRRAGLDETGKRILGVLDGPPPKGYARWTAPLIAAALGDVQEQFVWRFLRAQQIDRAGRKRRRRVEFLDFMDRIVAAHPEREIHVLVFNPRRIAAQRGRASPASPSRKHIDDFIASYNETARPFAWSKSEVHQKRLKPRFADL